jgi:hypothetical protein
MRAKATGAGRLLAQRKSLTNSRVYASAEADDLSPRRRHGMTVSPRYLPLGHRLLDRLQQVED